MKDGVFISRPDLWEKLLEQKRRNMELEVGWHINMGINQAIGIMNSMAGFNNDPAEMYEEG